MARFNVVMTAPTLALEAMALLEAVGCAVHTMAAYPSAEEVAAIVARVQADAVLSRQGPVNAAAMDASRRLRIVARHGVGVDDVDLPAAAARGIVVTRAPGSNTEAVAEHTLAMILALAKGLRPLSARIAVGGWRDASSVRDLAGMRLALLGLGAIGRAVARLAMAFQMRVVAFDPLAAPAEGVEHVANLDALLDGADIVSVHCPLNDATRGILGTAALARLRPGGFVINTARGGIVDEGALLAALDSGHLAGAALDVFAIEPPPPDDRLRNHPSVIVTPHVAGVTPGSLVRMGVMAAECIAAALTGGVIPPDRVVRG